MRLLVWTAIWMHEIAKGFGWLRIFLMAGLPESEMSLTARGFWRVVSSVLKSSLARLRLFLCWNLPSCQASPLVFLVMGTTPWVESSLVVWACSRSSSQCSLISHR